MGETARMGCQRTTRGLAMHAVLWSTLCGLLLLVGVSNPDTGTFGQRTVCDLVSDTVSDNQGQMGDSK